ncbi:MULTISPECIES: hypothetical protein [Clostridium]|uniref:Uncharacterized protein n=1 Tax=Clostridium senegalense TaxID=1465809 RepID=A0A6M0H6C9_9CLOT|nr:MULTISPECIES: hypothetical protein [Clostridium]NEU05132.1 hypothetical protein [Clostridium senegalense]
MNYLFEENKKDQPLGSDCQSYCMQSCSYECGRGCKAHCDMDCADQCRRGPGMM